MRAETITSSECNKDTGNPEAISPERLRKKTTDWRMFIHTDPDILGGKPVVKGTRLSADFILRLFANGWTFDFLFSGSESDSLMKFLADENVPLPSALLLRRPGWDVRHIAEDCPGEKDSAVMEGNSKG